jgi:hypothetical protein
MRPTDFCHPYDLRAPASRAFPASDRDFHRVNTPQSLRLRAVLPGDQTVHAVRTASADPPSHNPDAVRVPEFASCVWPHGFPARAWAFSSHGARIDRASDIPVANPSFTRTCTSLSCVLSVWRPVGRSYEVCVVGDRPRLPSTPTRDGRCFQQPRMPSLGEGPFVGSGGLYSPGPATPAWPFDPTAKTAG